MPRLSLIQPRRGTAAEWTTANPILAAGEMGLETDTNQSKRGDGVTTWTALPYVGKWDSIPGKPAVVAEGATQAAARTAIGAGNAQRTDEAWDYAQAGTATGEAVRTAVDAAAARDAIGAGTSNLAIGTTSSTAKAGNYQPTAANITDSTAVGRSVIVATDQAAARTAIGALSQTEIENLIGNYESESLSLFNRMTVRPDADHRSAINTLILTLKNAGVWTKLDNFYMLAAHTSQAALLNWIGDVRNLIAYNSPTFTANQGFAGNGTTSYLATAAFSGLGLRMTQGNESVGGWIRTSTSPASNGLKDFSVAISSTGGSGNRYLLHRNNTTGVMAWRMNTTVTQNTPAHTIFGNNLASISYDGTNGRAYWDGALESTATYTGENDPQSLTTLYYVIGRAASNYSTSEYSMGFSGSLLTAGDNANLYNATYDYMEAVGGL